MARTIKDEVMLKTIREWANIVGYTDEEMLEWTVKELRAKLQAAQGAAGAYWEIFLSTLKKNMEEAYKAALTNGNIKFNEINIMPWPKALVDPDSNAAKAKLDDVDDLIGVEMR